MAGLFAGLPHLYQRSKLKSCSFDPNWVRLRLSLILKGYLKLAIFNHIYTNLNFLLRKTLDKVSIDMLSSS